MIIYDLFEGNRIPETVRNSEMEKWKMGKSRKTEIGNRITETVRNSEIVKWKNGEETENGKRSRFPVYDMRFPVFAGPSRFPVYVMRFPIN